MTDAKPLLPHLIDGMSKRQFRLLRVAAARAVWGEGMHPVLRAAVEAAERYADGECDDDEADGHRRRVKELFRDPAADCGLTEPQVEALHEVFVDLTFPHLVREDRPPVVPALLRDFFGDPRPHLGLDPRWRTETVTLLAEGIYRERAFDRLPILADALEEAGCDRAEVLNHCRGEGMHFRGCWVVDVVLGKG